MEKASVGSLPGSPASKKNPAGERGSGVRRLERSASHGPVRAAGGEPPRVRGRHLEGVLNKYTNLLQGWQNRYFVLDPELGQLNYFINEQGKSQKPRGSLPLSGASVIPGDELPHMFIICAANGEHFKLRASDASEQELWMSQLQHCVRRHSDTSTKASSSPSSGGTRNSSLLPHPVPPAATTATSTTSSSSISPGTQLPPHHPRVPGSIINFTHHKSPAAARPAKSHSSGRLLEVKEVMSQAEGQQKNLIHSIESLPSRGPLSSLDQDLLLLKATSAATLSCLGECLNILQHNVSQATQHISQSHIPGHNHNQDLPTEKPMSGWCGARSALTEQLKSSGRSGTSPSTGTHPHVPTSRCKEQLHSAEKHPDPEGVDPSEETTDTEDNEEEDLGVLDDQRNIILHLLSQLKLGMDLTRVVLPTFILEKRSLLEMYANFMAHPDMFLAITGGSTEEERIVRFVEYYLTAFHEGRKGAVAKKPYNPILGESFRCTWDVPRDRVRPLRTQAPAPPPASGEQGRMADGAGCYHLRFVAEQVSHHPPISGFYCECRERRMCVNTHVWTKSKFMGMSVGVSMVGEGALHLLEHDEVYVFTLPCAYARSILTVPWVELGGKVSISCSKTGYSATVTFHTKPFYGGKVHRVTAEVKHNPTGTIVCKAQGEWNGILEFTYSNGETKVIDTCKLPVIRKKIRPVEKQGQSESRRLWQHVTCALKSGNIDVATEKKRQLEEQQRTEERQRAASNTPWKPKYFIKEGDGWVYHKPLWKIH
ncbi:oxysterol-binding protein-related protein 10 isoform X1 [Denticeps clupeoides]|uniref:Oxysterol-binding protein n=1 Tax=Denticeps clupeoides TaxID=299321 RepID=A0AAY4E9Q2_9TELE|nr:oxysterol-binding protein-related protein 10-like isoform X1 [Denticeps clupeoides]